MEFAIVATTVLVSLFVAYLAFLFLQFLFVLCRRRALSDRRRTCPLPDSTLPTTDKVDHDDIKDFVRSAWMNKTSSLSSKAVAAAAAAATAAVDSPLTPPPDSAVVVVPPPTDEEVEEMLMGMNSGLRGPPRFLFTIKEDEREGCMDETPPLSYDEEEADGGGVSMVRFMDILGVVKAEEVSGSSTVLSRQCSTLSSLLKDEVNGGGVLAS